MTSQVSESVTGLTGKHNFESTVYCLYIAAPATVPFTPASSGHVILWTVTAFYTLQNSTFSQMSQNEDGVLAQSPPPVPLHDPPESADVNCSDEDNARIAGQEKKRRPERDWELIGEWNPTTEDKDFIDAEIARIAKEKLAEGGITKLHSNRAKSTDLSLRKQRDSWPVSETTGVLRCPLSSRMKCRALLKVDRRDHLVQMFMSEMHTVESHAPAKDSGKYLKLHQKELVAQAVNMNPGCTAAQLRRNIHRTSPDKQILPKHSR